MNVRRGLGEDLATRLIEWAHSEVDAIRAAQGKRPMNWGNGMNESGKRYCVMCLADGEKVAATHVINAAGYCTPCKDAMVKNGHGPVNEIGSPQDRIQGAGRRGNSKLTDEQRAQIAESPKSVRELAKFYGVSEQTIYNVRALSKIDRRDGIARAQQSSGGPRAENREIPETSAVVPAREAVRLSIDFDVTEERADAIWRGLTLAEKAEVVRVKLLDRWPLLNRSAMEAR